MLTTRRVWLAVALLALALAPAGVAEVGDVTTRPLSDFLDAQGTTSDLFPGVDDYVVWANRHNTTVAMVDYAGLAELFVKYETGDAMGTRVRGRVTEEELEDGTAGIRVVLRTTDALAFAQSVSDLDDNDGDHASTKTVFGVTAEDVVDDDATPALGRARLVVSFVISEPGADLPDLIDLFNNPGSYAPISYSLISATTVDNGDGTSTRLRVQQIGTFDAGDSGFDVTKAKVDIDTLDD